MNSAVGTTCFDSFLLSATVNRIFLHHQEKVTAIIFLKCLFVFRETTVKTPWESRLHHVGMLWYVIGLDGMPKS